MPKEKQRNPFIYGRELGRSELVDREPELAEIESTIRDRGRLFLIGPRRCGKTSLLNAAGEAARETGTIVLRFDAERFESLDLLARGILDSALRALSAPLDKMTGWIAATASRLRPEIVIAPEDGSLTVRFGVSPEDHGEVAMLADALDALDELARRSKRAVVVILDEVQQVVVEHGISAERQLRASVQQHRHLSYIFAGSATRLLTQMTDDPNRPFYRLGSRLFLGPVPEGDFLLFLEKAFRRSGFEVRADACRSILHLAENVPYNVQRLAAESWEILRGGERRVLSADAVASALERIVRKEDPAYTQTWTSLTRNQKKALRAVAETDGTGILSTATARVYAVSVSSMQAAVRGLLDRHLVRPQQTLGQLRYCLVDPFFRAWLRLSGT